MKTTLQTPAPKTLATALLVTVLSSAAVAQPPIVQPPVTTPVSLPSPSPAADQTIGELVIDGYWG